MPDSSTVPTWWIVLFLVLALGAGAVAVLSSGGSLVVSAGALVPLPF